MTLRILKVRISGLKNSQGAQGTFEIRRGAGWDMRDRPPTDGLRLVVGRYGIFCWCDRYGLWLVVWLLLGSSSMQSHQLDQIREAVLMRKTRDTL